MRDGVQVRRSLSRRTMEIGLSRSLARLGTDYIDLYLIHVQPKEPFYNTPEEVSEVLKDFIRQGKIRAVGLCNVSFGTVEKYLEFIPVAVVQNKYSILDRRVEKEILPGCEEKKITFQAYSPLEKGMLSGKRTYKEQVTEKSREDVLWFRPEMREHVYRMLGGWQDLCDKYSCELSNLAAAWVAFQGEHVHVLCGARRPEQAAVNAKAGGLSLSPGELERMKKDADALLQKAGETKK
jgi:methylglyoxal reductase